MSDRPPSAEDRDSFIADALAAWEDYRRTGLHLTGEEVDRWLRSWGTDAEVEPPTSHT